MSEGKTVIGFSRPMNVSNDLSDIIGLKVANRGQCVKELWAYLKKNNLQDAENKQYFTPDKKMAKVFGTDKIPEGTRRRRSKDEMCMLPFNPILPGLFGLRFCLGGADFGPLLISPFSAKI